MPWVQFSQYFEFRQKTNMIVVYRPGEVRLVTRACAADAIGKLAAWEVGRPDGESCDGAQDV